MVLLDKSPHDVMWFGNVATKTFPKNMKKMSDLYFLTQNFMHAYQQFYKFNFTQHLQNHA